MILNEFIQGSSDENLLKSLPTEGISEDLIKAMNKAGLVQKEVQVRGKNGQTFTRKQWVKASDAQTQTAQPKQSSASGITEDDIKKEFKKTSVAVKDKWGDTIDTHTGYAGKNGSLCSIEKKGDKWVVNLGDTSRGFVAQTSKDTKEEAYALMYKNLGGTKKTVNSGDKSSKDKIKPGDSLTINGKSVEVLKVNDKGYTVKNAEGIVSQVSKKAVEDGVATHTSKTASLQNHFTGKSKDELWSNLKSAGYEVDGADKSSPQDKITLYKDKQEFTATFNKYSDGGVEVLNIKPVQSSTTSDKKPSQSYTNTGELHYNGYTISKVVRHGTHMYKVKGMKPLFGSQKQAKEFIDRQLSDQNASSNTTAQDKGKINHTTGVHDKPKTSMLEEYFAGNHNHSDAKSAITALLGKGYTRQDIMSQAETSGITWKKNDHGGINWMRASMAIQKAWKKG